MYRDSLSRRIGPVFAEVAAEADKATKRAEHVFGGPVVYDQRCLMYFPAPSQGYKPAHGGYPGTPVLSNPQTLC